jgi:uncharacterized membrane protein
MGQIERGWTDYRVEQVVGNLLRTGVILAAVWVLASGVLYLTRHGREHPDYRVFRGEPTDLRHVRGIARDSLHGRARGLIQFGLLLLIATPVARVAFSVFGFAQERDWLYVVITLIVLALLVYSLSGGGSGVGTGANTTSLTGFHHSG